MRKILALGLLLSLPIICSSKAGARSDIAKSSPLLEQTKQVITGKSSTDAQWIEEKTGQYLPLDLEFIDEEGKPIRLREIIDRPTILLLIYFYCPNICSKNLAHLAIALNSLSFNPDKEFRVIALSFNEAESYKDAARAKQNYLKIVGANFPPYGWRFLTGSRDAIKTAIDAVGF